MSTIEQIRTRIFPYLPWISIGLLIIGLFGFNEVIELRAAEGRRALVTFEMIQNNDLIVPYLHGFHYYNKPPFFNWVLGFFFALFGSISEFSVRFPGLLSFLIIGGIVWRISKNYLSKEAALLAAGIFLTFADPLFYGTINAGEIDLFYALSTMLQMLVIFYFFKRKNWLLLFVLSYILTAVGILTKGIPSIAFQGVTLLVYFIYKRSFWKLFSWQHILGLALMCGICFWYFYEYSTRNEVMGYMVNIFKQASQRSANEFDALRILGVLASFPLDFIKYLLPWSLLLVFLVKKQVRKSAMENDLLAFSIIFLLANIPFYWTAPDVRARYIYMFFPFMALLIAFGLQEGIVLRPQWNKVLQTIFQVIFGIGTAGLMVLSFLDLGLNPIHHLWMVVCAVALGCVLVLSLGKAWKVEHYWWLILVLGILRMGYNLIGLPYTVSQLPDFRGMTSMMIETAGDKGLHYYDTPIAIYPNLSLMGTTYYNDTLIIPDDFTSDFAYYYALYEDKVMDLHTEVVPGEYYLLFESDFKDNLEPISEFPHMIGGRTMLFCRGVE